MKWIKLKDTVINLEAVSFINLYLDRPTPMVQVSFQGDNGFLNFEDAGDVARVLGIVEAMTLDLPAGVTVTPLNDSQGGSWDEYRHRTGKGAAPAMKEALEELDVGLQCHLERWGDHEGRLVALKEIIAAALAQTEK